jgi:hypothetical protein
MGDGPRIIAGHMFRGGQTGLLRLYFMDQVALFVGLVKKGAMELRSEFPAYLLQAVGVQDLSHHNETVIADMLANIPASTDSDPAFSGVDMAKEGAEMTSVVLLQTTPANTVPLMKLLTPEIVDGITVKKDLFTLTRQLGLTAGMNNNMDKLKDRIKEFLANKPEDVMVSVHEAEEGVVVTVGSISDLSVENAANTPLSDNPSDDSNVPLDSVASSDTDVSADVHSTDTAVGGENSTNINSVDDENSQILAPLAPVVEVVTEENADPALPDAAADVVISTEPSAVSGEISSMEPVAVPVDDVAGEESVQ